MQSAAEKPAGVYGHTLEVPEEALDENGHVNNVVYVQWMQDVAIRHFTEMGGMPVIRAAGAIWVVRSHHIEYLRPAFAGDRIEIQTWVADLRRVASLRRYRFCRLPDYTVLAQGETDWVLVDAQSLRPRRIPVEVAALFTLVADYPSRKS